MSFPDIVKQSNCRKEKRVLSFGSYLWFWSVGSLNTEMHASVINRSALWTPEDLRACSAGSAGCLCRKFAQSFTFTHSVTSLPAWANLPAFWRPARTHGSACLLGSTPAESWVNGGASGRTTDLKMCRQALRKSPLLHCLTSSICFFG